MGTVPHTSVCLGLCDAAMTLRVLLQGLSAVAVYVPKQQGMQTHVPNVMHVLLASSTITGNTKLILCRHKHTVQYSSLLSRIPFCIVLATVATLLPDWSSYRTVGSERREGGTCQSSNSIRMCSSLFDCQLTCSDRSTATLHATS